MLKDKKPHLGTEHKTNHVICGLGLWASPVLGRGGGWRLAMWVNSMIQSCLHNENPINNNPAQRNFLVGEYVEVPGRWHTRIPQEKGIEAQQSGSSQTSPSKSLPLDGSRFIFFKTTIIMPSCILSHFSELSNLRESREPLGCVASWSELATGAWRSHLQLTSEVGGVLLGTIPFNLWDLHQLQVVNIRTVLQHTTWYQNTSLPPHF